MVLKAQYHQIDSGNETQLGCGGGSGFSTKAGLFYCDKVPFTYTHEREGSYELYHKVDSTTEKDASAWRSYYKDSNILTLRICGIFCQDTLPIAYTVNTGGSLNMTFSLG